MVDSTVTAKKPWHQPPWFASPAKRIGFLDAIKQVDPDARTVKPRHAYRGGFGLQLSIQPPDLPSRRVEIYFSLGSPGVPRVFVDGPEESSHRYSDGSLCMWYPYDPPDLRWWPTDGPEMLLGHIAAHVIKEEWYRRNGEWLGDEVAHAPRQTISQQKEQATLDD